MEEEAIILQTSRVSVMIDSLMKKEHWWWPWLKWWQTFVEMLTNTMPKKFKLLHSFWGINAIMRLRRWKWKDLSLFDFAAVVHSSLCQQKSTKVKHHPCIWASMQSFNTLSKRKLFAQNRNEIFWETADYCKTYIIVELNLFKVAK